MVVLEWLSLWHIHNHLYTDLLILDNQIISLTVLSHNIPSSGSDLVGQEHMERTLWQYHNDICDRAGGST